MAEPLLENFAGRGWACTLPRRSGSRRPAGPRAQRTPALCVAGVALSPETGTSTAHVPEPSRGGGRNRPAGLHFRALAAYYRRGTPERDALLLPPPQTVGPDGPSGRSEPPCCQVRPGSCGCRTRPGRHGCASIFAAWARMRSIRTWETPRWRGPRGFARGVPARSRAPAFPSPRHPMACSVPMEQTVGRRAGARSGPTEPPSGQRPPRQ